MPKSSISTMWAIGRFDRAADFVSQARAIGFDQIELNHQVTEAMLEEYRALQEAGETSISSVHAPCPKWRPVHDEALPELSSLNGIERVAAVGIIKRTIDVAVDLRVQAVVVHSGRVEMDFELERALRRLFHKGQFGTAEYQVAKEKLVAARAAKRDQHLHTVMKSLKEVVGYAAARGVRLGLENRYHYYEMPLPDEMRLILDAFDPSTVFYWHDSGHAHGLAVMGLVGVEKWLHQFHKRTLGLHLHDAIGLKDHRVAGIGEIDFVAIRQQIESVALRVCEFDRVASPEEVQAGYNYLKRLGIF